MTSAAAAEKGGSQIYLEENEQLPLTEMLKSVVVSSANDCACALAEHIAGSEAAFVQRMNERAQELGVKFYFNTPVQKLLADGKKGTGLIAKSDDGTEYEVSAKAVIIATGGFGTNPEMVKQYCNYTLEHDMFDFLVPGIMGDGIRMAWEIGAGHGRMEMELSLIHI